jgi:hypothetical protein
VRRRRTTTREEEEEGGTKLGNDLVRRASFWSFRNTTLLRKDNNFVDWHQGDNFTKPW